MQSTMNHQMMGYDRAITMFSPDGRLLQVEYARKMVKQGSTAIGMICKDGVIIVTDKRIVDKLVVPESIEKIWKIDQHMGGTIAGMVSDARVLFERAQMKAQQHKVTYDTPIDVLTIVKDMCNLKQVCTQSGGLRPFGVSTLVIGVEEEGPTLFETDPAGIYFRYKATTIGEGENEVGEILRKEYKDDLTMEQGFLMAMKALVKVIGKEITAERLDAAYVSVEDKEFTLLPQDRIEKLFKEVKKK